MREIPLNPRYGNQAHFCMASDEKGNTVEIVNPYAAGRARVVTMFDFFHDYLALYLEDTLKQQIEQGILKPQKTSRKVPNPMGASMTAMCLNHIDTIATTENTIRTDMIIRADIELWDSSTGVYCSDTIEQWYRCPYIIDLTAGEMSITAMQPTVYRKQDKLKGLSLDEYLIPIIQNDDHDKLAEQLLGTYYPEVLAQPLPVFGDVFAQRIGYGVMNAAITPEHSIQGQCFFVEDRITTYNTITHTQEERLIPAKTLLIDQCPDYKASAANDNDAKTHECLHALLDRHFFLLQRLFDEELRCLSSPAIPDFWGEDDKPMRVIEARISRLTPRVRMPATQTRKKIEELLDKHHVTDRKRLSNDTQARRLRTLIRELAGFYCVSLTTAKLRMVELGYNCAKGVMDYCGDICTPWYSCTPGSLAWNQTLTISLKDAAKAYGEDQRFAALLDTGCFVYVEGHFCLDEPQYVETNRSGAACLTAYARQHADECCLVFTVKGWSTSWEHTGGALYRETHPGKGKITLSEDGGLTIAERAALIAEARNVHKTETKLPTLFCDTLAYHMSNRGLTLEQLSESSGISARTLSVWRNDEGVGKSVRQLTALCIGLHLEPELSQDLFQKGGQRFIRTEEHALYSILLRTMYHASLLSCNAVLQEAGVRPLNEQ